MKKKVLIINTGGTISSVASKDGFQPETGFIAKALSDIPSLHHLDMPQYELKEYEPLLDSSNMNLSDWNDLARTIEQQYDHYDGFLIFHGTDTMAYTASALSFMLQNLSKPVILTGSQIPLSCVRNDAYDNVLTSLWLCAHEPLQEVCIYFNQRLLRGNRSQKVSSYRFDAFDSPNFPWLATIGTQIELRTHLLLSTPQKPFAMQTMASNRIANFRLFPGFSTDILDTLLNGAIKGLVIETYGSGNAQNNDPHFLRLLRKACDRGVIIINCSQCYQGVVRMEQYATGNALAKAGLLSGYDMTLEAAHCKLLYLFSLNLSTETIVQRMQQNLVGELSVQRHAK